MSLSFSDQLILTIVDKLLIGLLVVAAGVAFNFLLEKWKARNEFVKAVAVQRVEAYRKLWITSMRHVTESDLPKLREDLVTWYDEGDSLFLSFRAAGAFFEVLRYVQAPKPSLDEVQRALSRLRTELKVASGTYSRKEAETQIPGTS